jgi:hypothetical protein
LYESTTRGTGPETVQVSNNFFVQGPAVEGQVVVRDSSGSLLAERPATGGAAAFALPASAFTAGAAQARGSSAFLVTFTADAQDLEAGPGSATLSAFVPNPMPDQVVGVDPVSSLIAEHLAESPELTFDQAADDVFSYLGLPLDTDPQHLFQDTPFDSSLFFDETTGDFDSFLDTIVDEIGRDSSSQGRFLSAGLKLPPFALALAEQLKSSTLDFVFGEAISAAAGWLGGLIGIPSEPSVQQVLDAIDSLRQDVARLSQQIDAGFRSAAYNTKDLPLVSLRGQVSDDNETLRQWASPTLLAPPTQAQVAQTMSLIKARYTGALINAINAELPSLGASGLEPGLIQLYIDGVVPRIYSAATVGKARLHLTRALDFQQLILNLQVEAFHFERPALLYEAERAVDNYFADAKRQLQEYPLSFDEENLLLDRGTGLLWTRRPLVVSDFRDIAHLVAGNTLGGTPAGQWRLPTATELDTLVSATGGTGIDQNTNIGLKREGFLPINGRDQVGDWGLRDFNWEVLVGPINYLNSRQANATMINVSNFRRRTVPLADYDGRFDIVIPKTVAFYLVRQAPTVESLSVSETARTAFTVTYKATARLSDGSTRDLTDLARWSVLTRTGVAATHDVAKVSNARGDDGRVTLRINQPQELTVVASYKGGIEGRLAVPSLSFQPPAITNIVISPVRYRVPSDGYPFSLAFSARSIRANGQVEDADSAVTWTSSDPSVQISASGLVTASKPASKKTVTIKAKLGDIQQTARVVLDP